MRIPNQTAELSEFKELALSAGATVVGVEVTTRDQPDPKYFIGKGKVEELFEIIKADEIDILLVNYNLSASQERNLEKKLCCRVVDRVGLILDIFAKRARTHEGKLQVELAQLEHISTRLVRGWTHLERQKGGIGLRGPGETQLELDKRMLRDKIKNIRARLAKVRSQRLQGRRSRQKASIPTVALVGYTNSGKSTLFSSVTNHNVYQADQLFATLDPTLKSIQVPVLGKVILADTVGFVRDLPHTLVDAFRATLEETNDADLLLHVIDANDPLWREKKVQVESVLHEIDAGNVPRLDVYNKIDLLNGKEAGIDYDFDGRVINVSVSAKEHLGLSDLIKAISLRLSTDVVRGTIELLSSDAKIRAYLYEIGAISSEQITDEGNYLLDICVQKDRWLSLMTKFENLKSFGLEKPNET